MNQRFFITAIALALTLTITACAAELKNSPAARLIEDYLAALNSGQETTMRAFLESNVAPSALATRPVEKRLEVMKDLSNRWGSARINQVRGISDTTLTVILVTKNGEQFKFTLFHDRSQPPKMLGLGIQDFEPPTQPDAPSLSIDQFLDEVAKTVAAQEKADEFSGVVLIARDGKPIYQQAVGKANVETGVANKLDTKFNLGSINKKFTQLAIDLLAERGKLSYADTLGKFIPDYPNAEARSKVTVGHLIRMEGGIGDFFGEKFEKTPKTKFRHNRDFVPMFASEKLHFEPGTQNEYSNGGYVLLGIIVENASGQDYYDFVRDNIFKPAGMLNSAWYEADSTIPNLAQGYTTEGSPDGKRHNNVDTRPARGSAAGGGYSTAQDLLKFANAARAEVFGNISAGYQGMGVAGGAPGINAALETDLNDHYTVIVLSNYDPPSAESLARKLSRLAERISE